MDAVQLWHRRSDAAHRETRCGSDATGARTVQTQSRVHTVQLGHRRSHGAHRETRRGRDSVGARKAKRSSSEVARRRRYFELDLEAALRSRQLEAELDVHSAAQRGSGEAGEL